MSDPMPEDGEAEYGIVMPFVLCKSNGGPYDDAAFVSGARMGALEVTLRLAQAIPELKPRGLYAHPEEAQQIDLLAMRFGFTSHAEPYSDEWTLFEFDWPTPSTDTEESDR